MWNGNLSNQNPKDILSKKKIYKTSPLRINRDGDDDEL